MSCIKGNGASISALRESGVDADVLIAPPVWMSQHGLLPDRQAAGRQVYDRPGTQCRICYGALLLKEALGIDLVINPKTPRRSPVLRFPLPPI